MLEGVLCQGSWGRRTDCDGEKTWMSRVKIRNSSSLARDSPMQWRLPGLKNIFWWRLGFKYQLQREEIFHCGRGVLLRQETVLV